MRRTTPCLVLGALGSLRVLGGCFFAIPDVVAAGVEAGGRDGAAPVDDGAVTGPDGSEPGHFCSGFDRDGGWCADFDDGRVPSPFRIEATDPGAAVVVVNGELVASLPGTNSPRTAAISVLIPGHGDTHVEMTIALTVGRLEAEAGAVDLALVDSPPVFTGSLGQSLDFTLVAGAEDNAVLPALEQHQSGGTSSITEQPTPFATTTRHHVVLDIAALRHTVVLDGTMIYDQSATPQTYDDTRRTLRVGLQTRDYLTTPALEAHIDDVAVRYR